jgi:DNA-binding transcriptional ArsR family regulator
MAAVASPARQEIVDVLMQMGRASVAEIARTLGRPPDSLYYHVRALDRAGLVRQAGNRGGGRRREAIYRTDAPELTLRYDPTSPANVRGTVKIIGSMLRLTARDFRRAFRKGNAVVEGPRREMWAIRATGWLTPAMIAAVNRRMRELKNVVSKRGNRAGRLYAITLVLVPLDRGRARRKEGPRVR